MKTINTPARIFTSLAFILLLGTCSSPVAAGTAPKMPSGVQDYSQWVGFKEGSWCKHETLFTNKGVSTKSAETFTLTNSAPDKLMVRREVVSTDAQGAESKQVSTYTLTPAQTSSGSADSNITEGDEVLSVGDQKIPCHFFKGATKRDNSSRTWTIWVSPKVPGGVVKQTSEMITDGTVTSTMNDTLKEFQTVQ